MLGGFEVIFLAPISGFDQVLTEDRTVNRLVRLIFSAHVRGVLIAYHFRLIGRLCPALESIVLQQASRKR